MNMREEISLSRDCEAIQIPAGSRMMLPKGTHVKVTQTLGGSFTVITEDGFMVRIAGRDADALGQEVPQPAKAQGAGEKSVEEAVWDELRTCYDPEIPINIVELGLIYDCQVAPLPEGGNRVSVKMTLTAPGCGMGGALSMDVKSKILDVPGVRDAEVELVWDPPWNPSRMSEAARLHLGLM